VSLWDRFGIIWASLWGHFWHVGRTLERYLNKFDVEKHEMASVMGISAGLVGPKSENIKKRVGF